MFAVSTIIKKDTVRVRVALQNGNKDIIGYSKQFIFYQPATNLVTTLVNFNKLNNPDVSSLNFSFNLADKKVGDINVNTQVNVVAADLKKTFKFNVLNNQGAGVTFVSIHNIVASNMFNVIDGAGQ